MPMCDSRAMIFSFRLARAASHILAYCPMTYLVHAHTCVHTHTCAQTNLDASSPERLNVLKWQLIRSVWLQFFYIHKCVSVDTHWAESADKSKVYRSPRIVGPQYRTCFMSPFHCLAFRGGPQDFWKHVDSWKREKHARARTPIQSRKNLCRFPPIQHNSSQNFLMYSIFSVC